MLSTQLIEIKHFYWLDAKYPLVRPGRADDVTPGRVIHYEVLRQNA